MCIYSIYKVTNNINGKIYIGFDSKWPRRKNNHKQYAKTRFSKFYSAIKKYGWDNFEWEVIYQSKDGEHTLNIMEKFFINQYNSYEIGYNETLGGEGTLGWIPSEEYKKRKSDEQKGEKGFWYGKKHSVETKQKIIASLSKKHLLEKDGLTYEVFNLKDFCEKNDLNRRHLYSVLNGDRKQHKGWKLINKEV